MKNFCDTYNVSRETYSKLELYCQTLIEWQNKINLVSNNSLQDVWNRHFADSAQLFKLIPDNAKTLVDIGSGAGFPGMVLAIISNEKTPYLKTTLVESIRKKTLYLNYVKDSIDVKNLEIINDRAESIKNQKYDVITSRAVTALANLLAYAEKLLDKNGICIFPKGSNYQKEIDDAKKIWKFSLDVVQSSTSEEGKILIISNLTKKGSTKCQE